MKNNIIDHWRFVAILVLCFVFIESGCSKKNTQQSGEYSSTITDKTIPQMPLGNKESTESNEAKVKSPRVVIKAYLNIQSGCQGEVIELLEGFKKTYLEKVKIEYIDFGTKEGLEQTLKNNLHCMTILINDKQTFELGNKKVTFSHPMGMQWTAEDMKMAVKQEVEKMYKWKIETTSKMAAGEVECISYILTELAIFEASFMEVEFTAIRLFVSLPLVIMSPILLGNYLMKRNYKIMEGK